MGTQEEAKVRHETSHDEIVARFHPSFFSCPHTDNTFDPRPMW